MVTIKAPSFQRNLYSLVSTPSHPGAISQWTALAELAGMHISEARYVLGQAGTVILSHLTEDAAKDYIQALAAKGIQARAVEETAPRSEAAFHPVIPVRKLRFSQNELPCVEGRWRSGFPPLPMLFPNVTAECVLRTWNGEDPAQEIPSTSGRLTLFDGKRQRLCAPEIRRIELNTGTGTVLIWLSGSDGLSDQSAPCLAVLGDVETVPLDERSRKG